MAVQLSEIAPQLQTLFTTAADQAAQKAQLIRRRRKLSSPAFAQGLVFAWLEKPDATGDDRTALQTAPLPAGALRLADLGFFDLDVLQAYDKQKVYFVTRPATNLTVYDTRGRKWKLARYLGRTRRDRIDEWVWAGSGKK